VELVWKIFLQICSVHSAREIIIFLYASVVGSKHTLDLARINDGSLKNREETCPENLHFLSSLSKAI